MQFKIAIRQNIKNQIDKKKKVANSDQNRQNYLLHHIQIHLFSIFSKNFDQWSAVNSIHWSAQNVFAQFDVNFT